MSAAQLTPAKLASRMHFMAKQLRGEAQRHEGTVRAELLRGARQLNYAHRSAYSTDPDVHAQAVALVDGAVDYMVLAVIHRTKEMQ